jgi:hypothetical protein
MCFGVVTEVDLKIWIEMGTRLGETSETVEGFSFFKS